MIQKQYWIDGIICGGYYVRSAPLWNFTQPLMAIPFRRFGTIRRSPLQYTNKRINPNFKQSLRCI